MNFHVKYDNDVKELGGNAVKHVRQNVLSFNKTVQ